MRLLLDEHYVREIAELLRDLGHDAVSVSERPDLKGLFDEDIFRQARAERRAILTENWADFGRLFERAAADGTTHYGIVFTSRRRLPRGRATIGLYVRVLDEFLHRHPADDALASSFRWLPDRNA